MSFSVQEILEFVNGRVVNREELGLQSLQEIKVEHPSSLRESQPHELGFFFSRAFEHELVEARPGILVTGDAFVKPLQAARLPFWKTTAVIACSDPYFAMALLSEKFAERISTVAHLSLEHQSSPTQKVSQIHPTAIISSTAVLDEGVRIGAHSVVESGAKIGKNAVIYPGCYLGPNTRVGSDSVLFPHVTLYECVEVGNRVRIHSGSVIGSDGFGYAPKLNGKEVLSHQKIYHLGKVMIEDDVEIGANSCVDRGTIGETRIGKGSKLDNMVHIGHNSTLDEGVVICGGSCLAGNSKIGKFVYIGGLSGVTNHVHIKDRASVGALTLVTKDVEMGGTAVGNPQRNYREHFKAHALLGRLLAERRSK